MPAPLWATRWRSIDSSFHEEHREGPLAERRGAEDGRGRAHAGSDDGRRITAASGQSARAPANCTSAVGRSQLIDVREPYEWQICCGSAGIYNLVQPEAAAELGKRKAANLAATEPDAIAAGNPGCALQIAGYMDREVPIYHPMTLLDASQRNLRPEEVR